jgi:hypothetical protein
MILRELDEPALIQTPRFAPGTSIRQPVGRRK